MLTSKQRAYLRSQANDLQPIIQIGKNGINDALIELVVDALDTHELVKIKVLETAFLSAREACDIIVEKTKCEPVQCIGYKFVIYKRSTKEKNQKIELAAATGKKKKKKDPAVKPGEKAKAAKEAKKAQKKKFFEQVRASARSGGRSPSPFKKSSSSHSRSRTVSARKGSGR